MADLAKYQQQITKFQSSYAKEAVKEPFNFWGLAGFAVAAAYTGSVIPLLIALIFLVQADPPPFGLNKDQAEHVRATALLVAGWFAVFALPLFLMVKDEGGGVPIGRAVSGLSCFLPSMSWKQR